MKMKTSRKIAVLGLTALLGIGVAVSVGTKGFGAYAEHVHTGNHYTEKAATKEAEGIKEYWVCCSCNEHYLEKPAGNWAEATHDESFFVNTNDDRCIKRLGFENAEYSVDESTGKVTIESVGGDDRFTYSVNEDGEIAIDGVKDKYSFRNDDNTTYDIVIPDGVTEVNFDGAFDDKNIGTIIIPDSVTDLGDKDTGVFANLAEIKNVVYMGDQKTFAEKMLGQVLEACLASYKNNTFETVADHVPEYFYFDADGDGTPEVRYQTSSKVQGNAVNGSGKTSAGYVFYFKDSVPSKLPNKYGTSMAIGTLSKDQVKKYAAFGIDNHETFINEANL